jgi:hypothetical protein
VHDLQRRVPQVDQPCKIIKDRKGYMWVRTTISDGKNINKINEKISYVKYMRNT